MLFHITHLTRYSYSDRVLLDPHVLRVRPRTDGTLRLIRFDLQVEPKPRGMPEGVDLDGTSIATPWFEGHTSSFTVGTSLEVETLRRNPFDFFVDPACRRLPMVLPESIRTLAGAYASGARGQGPVAELAAAIARESEGEVVLFVSKLARRIRELCEWTLREEGDPLPAEETLARRSGSCRDLAVLFIAACREQGVPARFVTGYHESGRPSGQRHLHAWGEVYLPGGGWRGFDPSCGLAVTDEHVPLAANADFRGAAPISGTYRGGPVTSNLRVEIDIRAMRSMAQ